MTHLYLPFNRQLNRDPDVIFAGYKIPHPLEHVMLIRVQTNAASDPVKAFRIALRSLQEEFKTLKDKFMVCCLLTFFYNFFVFIFVIDTFFSFKTFFFFLKLFSLCLGPTERKRNAGCDDVIPLLQSTFHSPQLLFLTVLSLPV